MSRIFNRKFPNKISVLETFLSIVLMSVELVTTPEQSYDSELLIRDVMDRPILRAAINADVDVILTGDKDFLESGILRPRILTAATFLKL